MTPGRPACWRACSRPRSSFSEIPAPATLLVEQAPGVGIGPEGDGDGTCYVFHAPLSRSACEALGRATSARLGRRFGRNLALGVADLGWVITLPAGASISAADIPALIDPDGLASDVLEGLDRGDLPARRFRHVAATALMVLRNPEGPKRRVGGMHWVSTRLYPLVRAACPDHPLLRETRREVLDDLLDTPGALDWLSTRPEVRFRALAGALAVRHGLDRAGRARVSEL